MTHKCFWVFLMMLLWGLQTTVVFGQQETPKEFQLQDFLILLIIYVLISLGLVALCLLANIYLSRFFSRIIEYSKNSGGKAFLLGLGNGVSIFAVLVLLGQFEGNPIQILIIPLLLVGIIGILLGFFAESKLIGQRLMEYRLIAEGSLTHNTAEEPSPVAAIVAGVLVIAFGALVPIIGQLALLLIMLKGFGAVIGAVFLFYVFSRVPPCEKTSHYKSRRNKDA